MRRLEEQKQLREANTKFAAALRNHKKAIDAQEQYVDKMVHQKVFVEEQIGQSPIQLVHENSAAAVMYGITRLITRLLNGDTR